MIKSGAECTKWKSTSNNLKNKAVLKMYYLKNKDTLKTLQRAYYAKNKGTIQKYRFTHKAAIREGLRKYYLKHKEDLKQYYVNNRAAIQKAQKLYYAKNKEALKGAQRAHYWKNKEAIQEVQRKYYLKNKENIKLGCLKRREAIREMQKEYRIKNREALRELARKHNLKKKKPRRLKIWTSQENVRQFFEYASAQLYVSHPMDWYRISRFQMINLGGASLYSIFGNLGRALQYAFPTVDWDMSKFSIRGKKARQRWLRVVFEQVIPEKTQIFEDYLHPELFWDERKYNMELDIWVPKYKLALEYQGEHHYHELFFAYGPSATLSLYARRDLKKKEACASQGITLITIPYWWDGKMESLASTLFQIRPDIFPMTQCPQIPISPPNSDTISDYKIQGTKYHF